jgi:uncharacterized RDD family membrane protein YckC
MFWLISCILVTITSLQAQEPTLLVSGGQEHLWILLPDDAGWQLAHASQRGNDPEYRVVRHFESKPLTLQAIDQTLWLVFSGGSSEAPRLEFYHLHAENQPALDLHVMEPREGLNTLPSVRDVSQLHCFVGTTTGPVLLGTSSADPDHLIGRWLRQGRWEPLVLPESLDVAEPIFAVETNRGLLLVQPVGATVFTWLLDREQHWDGSVLSDMPSLEGLVSVDGQPLVVLEGVGSTIEFEYLQSEERWPLAIRPRPDAPWGVLGQRGAVMLLSVQEQIITAEALDSMSGATVHIEAFEPASVLTSGLWSVAIALGLASTVILVIVLARGGDISSMVVPSGWSVFPPMLRLCTLLIDLIPGGCVYFLLASGELRHLVRVPLMSLDTADLAPYLILVAVTVIWCAAFEFTLGWTPGKRLFGACVRTTLGGRPGMRAIVVRNVMKGLVLLVPPLVVLAMLHPNQQGIGDLMARTIVVRPVSESAVDGGTAG